jgi:alpha-beta hydrolase superfamily lysophospholipase
VAVVVFNHGIAEHGGRYPHAVLRMVQAGYGVYALDARGHGRSAGRRVTVKRFSELVCDLDTVVDGVVRPAHAVPLFLLGFSLGGAIVVAYALDHQDELAGAVVIGSALGRGSGVSRLQFVMASLLSTLAPRLPVIRMCASDMIRDPAVVRAYSADPLVHHGWLNARIVGEAVAALRWLPREFHRLSLPLLLLHGTADITASPEGSSSLYDGARSGDKTIKMYAGHRHDLLNDREHDVVLADIVAWLDSRR